MTRNADLFSVSSSFQGDAFALFKKFARRPGAFFLDSSMKGKEGAVSLMGFGPALVLCGKRLEEMRDLFALQRRLGAKAVGYIAYEGAFHFGLYTRWIALDHAAGRLRVHAPDQAGCRQMLHDLKHAAAAVPKAVRQTFCPRSNFDRRAYTAAVRRVLAAIRRGDVYQVNLSRQVTAALTLDPLLLYAALRHFSPSPFAAYYDAGGFQILSSSPERFLKVRKDVIEVKPMKGTRPRGKNAAQDARLARELKDSPKEIAELLMVTDLERNDLGRVCRWGSVKVSNLRRIERYATVFQATATLRGRLRPGLNPLDVLQAAFPSGSVTGTPKIAAMRAIKAIERVPRGFYTGALGHIDPNGDMDLSVLIRCVKVTPKDLRYHVGGGIVADSVPAAEYTETAHKAAAIERAIKEAARG